LTFWSRKATAHRVASGSVHELFATIAQIQKDMRHHLCKEPFHFYTIGHSFGGLIVYEANAPAFALNYGENVIANRTTDPRDISAAGLGDQVILLNPALETVRFETLNNLWSEYPNDSFNRPVLIAVSSETDRATGYLFPAGRLLSAVFFERVRWGQWETATHTVGNAVSFQTHRARYKPNAPEGERVELCLLGGTHKAPFWFVSADPSLMNGHNDLNGDKLFELFQTLDGVIRRGSVVHELKYCKW